MELSRSRKKRAQKGVAEKMGKDDYEHGTRLYFGSIEKLPTLFIEIKKALEPYVYLDLRNLIVLSIYETFHLERWTKLCIICKRQVEKTNECKEATFKFKSDVVFQDSTKSLPESDVSNTKTDFSDIFKGARKHPSITVEDKLMVVCGISSVLRFIFQLACHKLENDTLGNMNIDIDILTKLKQFLGFRGGCLKACAESSMWTKFCEIDMINSVNDITTLAFVNQKRGEMKVPETLVRFENHLSLPVKTHNIQRVIREIKKESEQKTTTNLTHVFAEGLTLLLSDLILHPSFYIFVTVLGRENFRQLLPKTLEWHDRISNQFTASLNIEVYNSRLQDFQKFLWSLPVLPIENLYLRETSPDPNLSQNQACFQQFTRQYEIDEAFAELCSKNISSLKIHEEDPNFIWDNIPLLAHPEGGSLPVVRQKRKCEQLAAMACYALQVYSAKRNQSDYNSDRRFQIVDFCSGGGHVGILLAWLLPECDVILVENKQESLRRAQKRISGIGLSNVFCFQSNLDYFECNFDMGVALHACGSATDLVIAKCVKVNASFVCCPCCYGGVQENHVLTYPRSTIFRNLSLRHYFVLCHASDQTEAKEETKIAQGKQCMAVIDTDRCLYATENQYEVKLCKIVPEDASPKNHILVGISSSSM